MHWNACQHELSFVLFFVLFFLIWLQDVSHCDFFSVTLIFVSVSSFQNFRKQPTLLWFAKDLSLTTETMMELLCLVGICLSLMVMITRSWRNFSTFFSLWFLYFSLYQVSIAPKYTVCNIYTITWSMCVFLLVVSRNLLENRRTVEVRSTLFLSFFIRQESSKIF